MAGSEVTQPGPNQPSIGEVTVLLRRWTAGDCQAREQLVALLYPELKKIAAGRMRAERSDHTLQPTALVSEFFLQMAQSEGLAWHSRTHFLAVASQVMRRLLIDYARSHDATKRGGRCIKLQIDGLDLPERSDYPGILAIDELLERLSAEEPRMAQVAELRCFGGLTHQEIAETIGVDERTAKRDWQVARAWLASQLRRGNAHVRRRMGTD